MPKPKQYLLGLRFVVPFKAVDLRNKSSINALTHGGPLWINLGAPEQTYSMIILTAVKKINIDEVHPVKILLKCLCQLDGELLEKNQLQSPP